MSLDEMSLDKVSLDEMSPRRSALDEMALSPSVGAGCINGIEDGNYLCIIRTPANIPVSSLQNFQT